MRVLILGAGGHGQVVANILLAMQAAGQPVTPLGYLDDDPASWGTVRLGLPVLGPLEAVEQPPAGAAFDALMVGIGENARRKALYDAMAARGFPFATAIHPSCVVSSGAAVGPGCSIAALSVVGTAVTLGADVVLNGMVMVGHHTVVGDHVLMGPQANLGGDIEAGEGVLIGMGATVMSQRRVGAWATVGAAALVTRNVPAGVTVVGQPAREVGRSGNQAAN
jgi:sugar O-acyltransferase (sialic acid O-acetyltransferase NeuD family)